MVTHSYAAVFHFPADEFVVKTFSAGTAALQLAGRSAQETAGAHQGPLTEEERELIKRQIDCRRRLIIMKSRNAEAEDPSGRTVIPQEDLQVLYPFFLS